MISSNLHYNSIYVQDARTSKMQKGLSLTKLLHNLIREYGTYGRDSMEIDVNTFDLSDKRLILSHIEAIEEYEHALHSVTATEAIFNENEKIIQNIIDSECDEVYNEITDDMRSNYR